MGRGGSKVKTPLYWDPTNRFQELERPPDAFSEKKWGGGALVGGGGFWIFRYRRSPIFGSKVKFLHIKNDS